MRLHRALDFLTTCGYIQHAQVRPFFFGATFVLLTGCYAEGNSHFLTSGEPERFSTMERCTVKAKEMYFEGASRFAGYTCTSNLLFWEIDRREFNDGNAQASAAEANVD